MAQAPAPSAWYFEAAPAAENATGPLLPLSHEDEVKELKTQMGIQPVEDEQFGWIAEYGMRPDALPSRWSSHTDPATGCTFYADHETQETAWENPLLPSLLRVLEAGRLYLQQSGDNFFEEQRVLLWYEHKDDLESWHGPLEDADGAAYFVNSATGQSSRLDPREETQYIYQLEAVLLKGLERALRRPDEGPLDAAGIDSLMESFSRKREQARQSASEDRACELERMGTAADWLRTTREEEVEAQRLQFSRKLRERRLRRSGDGGAGASRGGSSGSSTSSLQILEEAGMDFKLLPLDGAVQQGEGTQARAHDGRQK